MSTVDPDQLEVAPGVAREKLEGLAWNPSTPEELRAGLEKAFDYRGDVTITKKDGSTVEGYLFDRRSAPSLEESFVRVIPKDQRQKLAIRYAEIAALRFSDRDPAAGKSWEAWVKKYTERKAAGERNIALEPEPLG